MGENNKIYYIDNEEELLDWANKQAAKIDPAVRHLYFKETEPKEIVDLAKEMNLSEKQAFEKVRYILLQGIDTGHFVVKEDISNKRFIQHMEDWYLPRIKELRSRSVEWFKYHLATGAPDIVEKLAEAGVNWGLTEYTGSAGNKAHFDMYDRSGYKIATIHFDGSHKTFEVFWKDEQLF